MMRVVGLWVHLIIISACVPVFAQVDSSYIYNPSTPYGTLDLRIARSPSRYFYLQENVTFSFRESAPGVKTKTYRDMTNWDSSPYREGNLRERNGNQDHFVMNYRFLMPNNYDADYEPGYPIIIMLHGYGERGNCWFNNCYWSTPSWNPRTNSPPAPTTENSMLLNNDHNLLHGGLKHLQAVDRAGNRKPDDPNLDPKAFPGFVLFPQSLNGWHQSGRVEEAIRLLRLIIKKYNVDENRVYIHALSNGGGGLYQAVKRAPWLFAAALPMSAVTHSGAINSGVVDEVAKIPLWVFQGGKDMNPTPATTYNTIKALREAGAVVRYSLYSHLGHGTWNTAYNEPDFFSWILDKRKTNPHVTYGNPVICNTNDVGVTISFTKGFFAYQWEKDGEILTEETSNEIVVNTPGMVRGRFSRKPNPGPGDWEPWSDPIEVTEISPEKPLIEPLTSTHLRGPGLPSNHDNNTIRLRAAEKADLYRWYRNGNRLSFPHSHIDDTLRVASVTAHNTTGNGTYALEAVYAYCPSPPSDPIHVFFDNSAPTNMTFDAASANLKGTVIDNGVYLTWKDVVSNEVGYEIWRRKSGTQYFQFAGRSAKNAISFFDDGLQPATTYEYKLRAVSNTGVSNYIPSDDLDDNFEITTGGDNIAPSAPQDLRMVFNTINSFSLAWKPAVDNTPIKEYIINYGAGTKSTGSDATTFTVAGLPPSREFPVTVRAVDFAGNMSPASNQIIASTYVIGLNYKHSTGGWEDLDQPSMVATWADPEFTGNVPNITLNPRTQEDFFNFQFTGFLDVPMTGYYQFRLSSDDGSRLILDGDVLVDNDGQHGNKAVTSDSVFLSAGPHEIEIQYFDYSGGHILTLTFKRPDDVSNGFVNIPDSLFRSAAYDPGGTPPKPTGLSASAAGMNRINLTWSGPPDTDVEIYRSTTSNGTYSIIGRSHTGALADTFALSPSTTYYYRARSVRNTGVSGLSGVVSATTSADNIAPSVPHGLVINTESHTHVSITWTASTDNVKVTGYEIYLGDDLAGTSSIPAFMLSDLLPGTPYSVTVRAFDASDNKSAFSAPFDVSTSPSAIYYSTASGSLTDLDTWKAGADGSGASPTSFSGNGQFFVIANRAEANISEAWTVDGEASRVVVSDGITLRVDAPFQGGVELKAHSTIRLNNSTAPEFIRLDSTSTVIFDGTEEIPASTYGDVVLVGSSIKAFDAGVSTVRGNLTVEGGLPLKGASGNRSELHLAGDLLFDGIPAATASDNRLGLVLTENNQIITSGGDLYLHRISIKDNAMVQLNNPGQPVVLHAGSGKGGGVELGDGSTLDLGVNSLHVVNEGSVNTSNTTGKIAVDGGDIVVASSGGNVSNLSFAESRNTVDSLIVDLSGSGKIVIRSPLDIFGGLHVEDGALDAGGWVTLKSTVNATANIARMGASATISGALRVERYFDPVDMGWYDLSSPVSGVKVEDLQDYFPVTGDFSGASSLGDPSMFAASGNEMTPWPPQGGSNQAPLQKGLGYHTRIGGDDPFTLTLAGIPFQGDVELPAGIGWTLVGNPYASPVAWSETGWKKSGISNVIATWETKVINGEVVGRFVYHDLAMRDVVLQPGEGFWVRALGADPVLKVTEDAKVTTADDVVHEGVRFLQLRLKRGNHVDDAYIVLSEEATEGFDPVYEAVKIENEDSFNFATMVEAEVALAVNHLPVDFCDATIALTLTDVTPGAYTLEFINAASLTAVGDLMLTDNFTNTSRSVSAGPYEFSVTSDSSSWGSDRFSLSLTRFAVDLTGPAVNVSNVCEGDPAIVRIKNAQPGATYRVLNEDGEAASGVVKAAGDTVAITIHQSAIHDGENVFNIEAGFEGCSSFGQLEESATFSYTPMFEITAPESVTVCAGEQAELSASGVPTGGTYRWFDSDGQVVGTGPDPTFVTAGVMHETVYFVSGVHPEGCESDRATIFVFPDSLGIPEISQMGDTLFTQVDATYQWQRNGAVIPGATAAYYIPDRTAAYTLVVSRGECVRQSSSFFFVLDPDCTIDTATPKPSAGSVCGEGILEITITDTQADVEYFAINEAEQPLSHVVKSPGGTIVLTVPAAELDSGMNRIFIRTDYEGCILRALDTALDVHNVILAEPIISYVDFELRTDSVGALQWKHNGEMIEGATGPTYRPFEPGAYTVVVQVDGCSKESQPFDVIVTSVEPGSRSELSIEVFPVPAGPGQLMLNVRSPARTPVLIRVIDMGGKTVFRKWYAAGELGDNIPLMPPGAPFHEGLYIILANQGTEEVRRRFVIED